VRIVVLVKPVPDPAAAAEKIGPDGRLERSASPTVVNGNDEYALEAALKLVEAHGGEAIADTAWSVVTPAGESVVESVGAFPSVVLAEGDYTAVARHDDRIFQANFSVVPGLNRDIEVLAE
jgi:hypothetical protein